MADPSPAATTQPPLTVVQCLPAMEGGGVERGTLEVARALVQQGHHSWVVSAGGRWTEQLRDEGSQHLTLDIGKKSLLTLRHVLPLRHWLCGIKADVVHARSRLPAWLMRTTLATLPDTHRPRWVTTVHGFYSINRYSAVMCSGEAVIAVSKAIKHHIQTHYPATQTRRIQLIPRGIDPTVYHPDTHPSHSWLAAWQPITKQHTPLLLLPGRLSRLKGHACFIRLIARLKPHFPHLLGLITGEINAANRAYHQELLALIEREGCTHHIRFIGHRQDLREVMSQCQLVYSLSTKPESFGRTTLEALSLGIPVIGPAWGGVGEILAQCLPAGRCPDLALDTLVQRSQALLHKPIVPAPHPFTLERMTQQTVELYQNLCRQTPS